MPSLESWGRRQGLSLKRLTYMVSFNSMFWHPHSPFQFYFLSSLAPVPFKKAVCDRWGDFTVAEKLRVCIGTWNVNGGRHIRSVALKNQSTNDWLLDGPTLSGVAKEHVSCHN